MMDIWPLTTQPVTGSCANITPFELMFITIPVGPIQLPEIATRLESRLYSESNVPVFVVAGNAVPSDVLPVAVTLIVDRSAIVPVSVPLADCDPSGYTQLTTTPGIVELVTTPALIAPDIAVPLAVNVPVARPAQPFD